MSRDFNIFHPSISVHEQMDYLNSLLSLLQSLYYGGQQPHKSDYKKNRRVPACGWCAPGLTMEKNKY